MSGGINATPPASYIEDTLDTLLRMRQYALGEATKLQMCPVRHACPLPRAQPGYKALLRESQPARVPKMNFLIVEGDLHRGTLYGAP